MGYTSTRLEVNVVCGAVPPTPATREPYPDLGCGNGPRPIKGRFVHRGALHGLRLYPYLDEVSPQDTCPADVLVRVRAHGAAWLVVTGR
jgi:hypothetical protein